MARFHINLGGGSRVTVNEIDNGVILNGPDYPRGLAIPDGENFEQELRDIAAAQLAKAEAEVKSIIDEAKAELPKQKTQFNEGLEELIERILNPPTEE